MTPDLDKKLRAAYPLVFPEPLLNDEPIRCGDGWYHLLWVLCGGLETLIQQEDTETAPDYRAVQVKEKFGALRLYLDHETPEMTALLSLAERLSQHVCDVCGRAGRPRSGDDVERPLLVRTRCDEHVNWFGREGFAHAT